MRSALIIDFLLGIALQFFRGSEDADAARYVERAIALKAAGGNVDAHLQKVADYLGAAEGTAVDFAALISRIDGEVDELLARGSGGEEVPGPSPPPDDQPPPE